MFQAVSPPIIRSSKLYTQHPVFVELFLLLTAIVSELFQPTHDSGKKQKKLDKYRMLWIQFWAPDDGRRNRLNVASCWFCLNTFLPCYVCFNSDTQWFWSRDIVSRYICESSSWTTEEFCSITGRSEKCFSCSTESHPPTHLVLKAVSSGAERRSTKYPLSPTYCPV